MAIETLKINKIPYICVPLTSRNKQSILTELETVIGKQPDLIEWRADFFEQLHNTEQVLATAEALSAASSIPLLFTIRSEKEGGEKIALSEEEKVRLLGAVCRSSAVNMIDFEIASEPEHIQTVRQVAKENNKQLILSYHNFEHTPENAEIIKRVFQAEWFGADMAKVAVMPESQEDVLRLLEVTRQADHAASIPVVTMSMGSIGCLSRVIGWIYGSVITFAVGQQSSAPGQIPIEELRKTIEMVQETAEGWGK